MNELALLGGVLRRKWWVVLLTTVLVAGLLGSWGAIRKEQYSSTARLTVTILGESSSTSNIYQSNLAAESRVRSYAALVESDALLEPVSEQTGLSIPELRSRVSATPVEKTVLFDVKATADSPEDAATITQVVADVYPDVIKEIETPAGTERTVTTTDEYGNVTEVPVGESQPAAFATVVSDAAVPEQADPPSKLQLIGIGLLAGFVLGLLLGLLADFTDRRVRRPGDLEQAAQGIPVLGEVPTSKSLAEGSALLDFRGGSSAASEALRRVRTSLRFVGGNETPVYLITSALPGEGKTFTAANLARAFAEAGDRTLVIGADLRNPSLGTVFGMPADTGLSNLLAGQVDVEDVVFPGADGDPDVLPAGPVPPNPSELLGNGRIKDLLSWARERYDVIIVDAPPVGAVTDAVILAPVIDATILVAGMNSVTRTAIADTVENLRLANVTPSGVIANFVRGTSAGYGRYGYGYGEQSDKGESRKNKKKSKGTDSKAGAGSGKKEAPVESGADIK